MSVFNPREGESPYDIVKGRNPWQGGPAPTASKVDRYKNEYDTGRQAQLTQNAPPSGGTQRQKTLDWDKSFLMQRNPYAHTFNTPTRQGSAGTVSSGGTGGRGMISDVGAFEYDTMDWDKPDVEWQPFEQNYEVESFAPVGQFEAPVEAVDFREFRAPTAEEAQADPGYAFRLNEGQRALENAAAARGMLRTGNTWKDLLRYGQDVATSEYDKVYGRRRGEHDLAYQQALQANQDQYGRALGEQQLAYQQGAQTYDVNRKNVLDAYDRDFQRHQANQLGGLQATQANFGIMAGLHDRQFAAQQAKYGYDLQRATQEAAMEEAAAGRAQSASAANVGARERQYAREYNQAADEWQRNYDVWNQEHARRARAMGSMAGIPS